MPNKKKSAGKGSNPRNCFSKQYRDNYDQIDWSDRFEITFRIDKNTVGYFPIPEKKKDNTNDRRNEEISRSNGQ